MTKAFQNIRRWNDMWGLFTQYITASVRKMILGRFATAIMTEGQNGTILVDASDFNIGQALAFQGSYNIARIQSLERLLHADSRVLNVGAHVGTLLIPLAKKVREVIGIEANPRTFKLLQWNVWLNHLKNVQLLQVAASDKEGEIEFYCNRSNSGGSKVKPVQDKYEYRYDNPEIIKVKMTPLDNLIDGDVDLIVMDIEGSEIMALHGMSRLLQTCEVLQVEYDPRHITEVAGKTVEEFISLISSHFQYGMNVADPYKKIYSKDQFSTLIKPLSHTDLLFSKTSNGF